ncbi:3-oxoacyl-[acyl-carrier protein] reductase [Tamaricihabitans halophyticus]|uniref:3-oxoacyl-[acyl-carrier protein] reductase n=1 Tax=Tamaricihabitans halophyticus TaxID=1262583 RepID=A0A4R2R3T3_9PSEU|nr:SDR family oxidoreductase [Tamaricihabitans halophyticus]TCP56534.1 3-oxoacyl-[acyl-carrier protein] reductase [Tamaricihabitans halophyticus]
MTRTAIVTGGATGIGKATAARLRADGLDVVITGRRAELLAETARELGATPVAFDATDPAAITAALPALPPRVDVLVNNAGGNTDIGAPAPGDLVALRQSWLRNLEANLLGAVLVTTALLDRLAEQSRVITLGSIAARGGAAGYGAAKAAVETWNRELARTIGARGGTANVVSPGLTEPTEFFGGGLPEDRRAMLIEQTANGRAGTVDDIAAAIRFLASPEAGHITGQALPVNGGAA